MHTNNDALEYNRRGIAAFESKNYEMAKSLFAIAVDKDTDFIDARRNYGEVLIELGEYEKGVQTFVEILGKHGNDVLTLFRMAQLYAEIGKNDDAIVLLEKIIEVDPDNLDAKAMLAELNPLKIIGGLNNVNTNIPLPNNVNTNIPLPNNAISNNNDLLPDDKPLDPMTIKFENDLLKKPVLNDAEHVDNNEQADPITLQFGNEVINQKNLNTDVPEKKTNEEVNFNSKPDTLPTGFVDNNAENDELIGQHSSLKQDSVMEVGATDLQLAKFSATKFFERKLKNRDVILVRGAVEEDGDSYVIDLDPSAHGLVFHVDKKFVDIRPTLTTISLPDADEVQIYNISIKRNSPMVKLEFCVSDDLESFLNSVKNFKI